MQKARLMAVPQQLAELGALKLTFVGGEPLLHPHIVELLQAAKAANMTTCMVTNASLLDQELMQRLQGSLDWLTFSIDASADALHADMGRGLARDVAMGESAHLQTGLDIAMHAKQAGFKVKLNTVVTSVNKDDNMSAVAAKIQPDRWKVFKVLPIEGQNDGAGVEDLLISDAEFHAWVDRHATAAAAAGIDLIAEDNDQMMGTYAMLDARGRFFSNANGTHEYGPSGFDVGFAAAWQAVASGFDAAGFEQRGGAYEWAPGAQAKAKKQLAQA